MAMEAARVSADVIIRSVSSCMLMSVPPWYLESVGRLAVQS
jgi:hypothetical protein